MWWRNGWGMHAGSQSPLRMGEINAKINENAMQNESNVATLDARNVKGLFPLCTRSQVHLGSIAVEKTDRASYKYVVQNAFSNHRPLCWKQG
jgi:hypothetical protein